MTAVAAMATVVIRPKPKRFVKVYMSNLWFVADAADFKKVLCQLNDKILPA
jgi:hypothetical protein